MQCSLNLHIQKLNIICSATGLISPWRAGFRIPMRWGRKQRQLGYFKLLWYIKIRIFICFFFPKRWIQCNKNDLLVNFHHHLQQAPIWLPQCTLHKGLSIIIQGFISVNWCQLVIYLFLTYNSSQPVVY